MILWTEAYEVMNNHNGIGRKAANEAADHMWRAYLNTVAKSIADKCKGLVKGEAKKVIDQETSNGPNPWR